MPYVPTCAECAYGKSGHYCILKGTTYGSHCNNYYNEEFHCKKCGKPIFHSQVIYDTKSKSIYCEECLSNITQCFDCANAGQCAFNEYTGSLPKFIQQQARQGANILIQQTVKNPSVVAETCTSCPCVGSNNQCLRETNQCGNFKERSELENSSNSENVTE